MRRVKYYLVGLAALLMLPVAASADVTVCNTFESGPGLAKLGNLCASLRADHNKPGMSNDECWERFGKMGARVYDLIKKRQAASASMRAAMEELYERHILPNQIAPEIMAGYSQLLLDYLASPRAKLILRYYDQRDRRRVRTTFGGETILFSDKLPIGACTPPCVSS